MSTFLVLGSLLAPTAVERWNRALFDTTFTGIHRVDWFDLLLLIPYFSLMAVLSVYGFHRFAIIRGYLRVRRKARVEPASQFAELPFVTVQLPLFNERNVVDQLLEATLKIDYPRDRFEIQVLDDSTDDTHPYTEALCGRLQAQGHSVEYLHRTNRVGYKAGALQEGMKSAKCS